MTILSPARARLASFEHAYSVATQLREATGCDQFVVRTGNPFQPFRVTTTRPLNHEHLLVRVA
jgi:hypothetical protein